MNSENLILIHGELDDVERFFNRILIVKELMKTDNSLIVQNELINILSEFYDSYEYENSTVEAIIIKIRELKTHVNYFMES